MRWIETTSYPVYNDILHLILTAMV